MQTVESLSAEIEEVKTKLLALMYAKYAIQTLTCSDEEQMKTELLKFCAAPIPGQVTSQTFAFKECDLKVTVERLPYRGI